MGMLQILVPESGAPPATEAGTLLVMTIGAARIGCEGISDQAAYGNDECCTG